MLNYLIPIIIFCTTNDGSCNSQTKFYEEILDPVMTPSQCLMEANIHAIQFIAKWKENHSKEDVEFRIICKRSDQKT